MSKKAAQTGPGPILVVALEQHFPERERIIGDTLAYRILPFRSRAGLWLKLKFFSVDYMVDWMEKKMPGMWSGFLCRKRYIDEKLIETVSSQTGSKAESETGSKANNEAGSETGSKIETLVNLGAGFDTRAYRLPELSDVRVWEVDQPENINAKRSRLRKVFKEVPPRITLVPIDFDHQELGPVLVSHGYKSDTRIFFIWEAVSQYLTEEGNHKTFDFLAKAPTGSRLVFTYIRKNFIDGTDRYGHEYLYEKMILEERSWHFGIDPDAVGDLLGAYGWRVLEHLGHDELAERYVKPTGRKLLSTQLERIVYAAKL